MLEQITPLDSLIARYQAATKAADEAIAYQRSVREELITELALNDKKTHEFEGHRATVVKTTTLKVDENGLRKAIGAKIYNRLTTAKLDQKKLEKAVVDGLVDPVVVAQHATEKDNAAFIRFTESK